MPGEHVVHVTVSATELPHFRVLVDFLTKASVHADATEDEELREMVRQCRIELLVCSSTPDDEDDA